MDERSCAEEHLRIIRSLMERATVYRAISAPTALIGGVSSLTAAIWMLSKVGFIGTGEEQIAVGTRQFIAVWLLPLVVTAAANTLFLANEARREARPFLSSGLRLALRALTPALLIGAAVTYVWWRNPSDIDGPVVLALSWSACYGVALLATQNFAPRSLSILGWSFIWAALIWLLLTSAPTIPEIESLHGQVGANLAMGITFGLFHLIYAAATWTRRRAVEMPATQ